MADREKIIKELENLRDICNAKSNMAIGNGKIAWAGYANTADDAIIMLKEHGKKKFFVDSDGKITPLPDVVRCKDCKWYHQAFANEGRCVNHDNDFHNPDWYCADGKRADS